MTTCELLLFTFMYLLLYWYCRFEHIVNFLAEAVIVGCEANSQCTLEQACHSTQCIDPCNCGANALCRVYQHTPLCYCPAGYSGNPDARCEKRKNVSCGMHNA
jgi:hypothetical protein